jgi:hypothetical protein
MLSFRNALTIARALKDVSERDHFGSIAFATARNFATFWEEENTVNVRLSLADQARFLEEPEAFVEIPNAWGRQGWTTIHLAFVSRASFVAALKAAHAHAGVAVPLKKKAPVKKKTAKKAGAKARKRR